MALSIPQLFTFYNPLIVNSPSFSKLERTAKTSSNGKGFQLGPITLSLRDIKDEKVVDEITDLGEFSVFYCSCGKACRVKEYIPPVISIIQNFLSRIKDCDCDLSPADICYTSAPLNAISVPFPSKVNNVETTTPNSYSEIFTTVSSCYDISLQKMLSKELSHGTTIKIKENERPIIYSWSKSLDGKDIIRDVTYSPKSVVTADFNAKVLRSLIGNSVIGGVMDWEVTVNQFLSQYTESTLRSNTCIPDLLYILACPYIMKYPALLRSFCRVSWGHQIESTRVLPSLLKSLSCLGKRGCDSLHLVKSVLPKQLHGVEKDLLVMINNTLSANSVHFPAIALLAPYFSNQTNFLSVCSSIYLLYPKFSYDIMSCGYSIDLINETLSLMLNGLGQESFTSVIDSCVSPKGYTHLISLLEMMKDAKENVILKEKLNQLMDPKKTTIQSLLEHIKDYRCTYGV